MVTSKGRIPKTWAHLPVARGSYSDIYLVYATYHLGDLVSRRVGARSWNLEARLPRRALPSRLFDRDRFVDCAMEGLGWKHLCLSPRGHGYTWRAVCPSRAVGNMNRGAGPNADPTALAALRLCGALVLPLPLHPPSPSLDGLDHWMGGRGRFL